MVWHHSRNSFAAYWRQQRGYGKAEAILERKWPEKYNVVGHLSWCGRLYGRGLTLPLGRTGRIYHGTWGLAPFQALTDVQPGLLQTLPLMPEWHLAVAVLALLSMGGLVWRPLLLAAPLFVASLAAPIAQAWVTASSIAVTPSGLRLARRRAHATVALLHLVQPIARLSGRLQYGLTLWRQRGPDAFTWPRARTWPIFVGRWRAPEQRLAALQEALRATGGVVLHGGAYDGWDLEVRGGLFGSSRLLMAVEDSGSGTQLVRLRSWPHCPPAVRALWLLFVSLSLIVAVSEDWTIAAAFAAFAATLAWRNVRECGVTGRAIRRAIGVCGLLDERSAMRTRAPTPRCVSALDAEQERV
jgi:hypothetical protein